MTRYVTCIACPKGCRLAVFWGEESLQIEGNGCPRGIEYARQEVKNPLRMLTSTVATRGERQRRLPVKSSREIPRNRIGEAMEIIGRIVVDNPTIPGEVILKDFLGCGVDLVATGEWDGR